MSKKFLNINPQEVCDNGEHYVRYKGCDGKMHELPSHAITHNERLKELFIAEIESYHSVIMEAELTSDEARAVFQASCPNAIEVKDINVSNGYLNGTSGQTEFRFDATNHTSTQQRFPHYYAIDDDEIVHFYRDGVDVEQADINLLEDQETEQEFLDFFQRTLDSISDEITPALWLYFVSHIKRINFHFEFVMVEKHLYVSDKSKRTYDVGVLAPVTSD